MNLGLPTSFQAIIAFVKRRYGVRVHRWRTNMTGSAWQTTYADGSSVRWIESPLPKSPLSLAIFLHEVGHHVIGFDHYRLRCEEEFAAWSWAIDAMRSLGVEPDAQTHERFDRSMQYAIDKAQRRGLRQLPPTLARFSAAPARQAA